MSTSSTTPAISKQSLILEIIQLALTGLATVPAVGAGAILASTFLGIYQKAVMSYQAEVGQPFDVTKIPLEPLVP